jgi:hypothetical protein
MADSERSHKWSIVDNIGPVYVEKIYAKLMGERLLQLKTYVNRLFVKLLQLGL